MLPSCSAALLLCFLLCALCFLLCSALLSALFSAMLSALLSALLCSPLCFQQCFLHYFLLCFLLYLCCLKLSNIAPIWDPTCVENGSRIDPGDHLGGQEICSGGILPLGRVLERSWTPPGPQKSNWKRLLDGPRAPRRLVSALPGAQITSKRGPGGSPNRGPKADQA